MLRYRPKITYANVMATLAFFLAVTGGAYAVAKLPRNSVGPKQLRKAAVTNAKVKKGSLAADRLSSKARISLQGQLGVKGDRGEQGSAGTALYFARINADGTVDPTQSKGISDANVTRVGSGRYCISGLNPAPANAVGNIEGIAADARILVTQIGASGTCPAGTQVSLRTQSLTINTDGGFYLLLN
jgi:hypothetical protein